MLAKRNASPFRNAKGKPMPDGLVRLKWSVNPRGYHITKRDMRGPNAPVKGSAEEVSIRLQGLSGRDVLEYLVSRGRESTEYEAELLQHSIYLDLANSERQPGHEGVLGFVTRWGLLTRDWHRPQALENFIRARNSIIRVLGLPIRDVRPVLEELFSWPGRPGNGLGRLDVRVEVRRGKLQTYFEASSLLQFCALELLRARVGGIDVTVCHACGQHLPLPKVGRPKLYCDDRCKMRAWRNKHRDAVNRVRRQKRPRRHRPV